MWLFYPQLLPYLLFKGFADRDSSHEIAIFGHSSLLSVDEALKKQETDDDARFKAKRMVDFAQRDPRSLMASDVSFDTFELLYLAVLQYYESTGMEKIVRNTLNVCYYLQVSQFLN